jgi:DNA polymerase-3 subunit alpha
VDIKKKRKKGIELLVQTGAFDEFDITRETLMGNFEKVIEYAVKKKEDKLQGQTSLFEDAGENEFAGYEFIEYPEMSREDKLNNEKNLIGFYFSGHPMDEYKQIWQTTVNIDLGEPQTWSTGDCVLIGIIKKLKTIITSRGSKMAFAVLTDYNGEIEVTFFSAAWEKLENKIENDKVTILKGKIDYQKDKDKYTFVADSILEKHEVYNVIVPQEIHIRLKQEAVEKEENLFPLRDYLAENPGSCSMFIHIPVQDGEKIMRIFSGIDFTGNTNVINELENNVCVAKVWRR